MKLIYRFVFIIFILIISAVSYAERFKTDYEFGLYIVTTESMSPSIKKGSILLTRSLPSVYVGDVITFRNPLNLNQTITHRIVEVREDNGKYFVTKGDANSVVDPWQVRTDILKGKVIFDLPLVGYVIEFIRSVFGLFLLVIFPLSLIVLIEIDVIHKESRFIYKSYKFKYGHKVSRIRGRFIRIVNVLNGVAGSEDPKSPD